MQAVMKRHFDYVYVCAGDVEFTTRNIAYVYLQCHVNDDFNVLQLRITKQNVTTVVAASYTSGFSYLKFGGS
jgi:hypothetical protein